MVGLIKDPTEAQTSSETNKERSRHVGETCESSIIQKPLLFPIPSKLIIYFSFTFFLNILYIKSSSESNAPFLSVCLHPKISHIGLDTSFFYCKNVIFFFKLWYDPCYFSPFYYINPTLAKPNTQNTKLKSGN